MDKKTIESRLTPIFRSVFNNPSLILRDNMTSDDINEWDSLTHMILLTEIEKEFDIRFKIKEISSWQTVLQLIEIIESKL